MENITLRSYQQRLLDYVKQHPQQSTYHFIAPPGSGKTILGLAIFEELKRKTLILVPALLLREQWIATKKSFFNIHISIDLLVPGQITIATYQTLYLQLQEDPDFLLRKGIEFLILDEAHHLKKNWGEVVLSLKNSAPSLKSLSLTATSPLDSTQREWKSYLKLNGPIDEEISATELIDKKVLTPYQDFVYFIEADSQGKNSYSSFLAKQDQIIDQLLTDEESVGIISKHPYITNPLQHTTAIYEDFDFYVAMLLFLDRNGFRISASHWRVLGFKRKWHLPDVSPEQVKLLYQWLLSTYPELEIFAFLKKVHWLKEEGLSLYPDFPEGRLLESPQEKIAAINRIIIKEEMYLEEDLCGVVLFDRICEEALDFPENPNYYGSVPQFLSLQTLIQEKTELGMICGRFIIMSEKVVKKYFPRANFYKLTEVPGYLRLKLTDANRREFLQKVTFLLDQKILNCLIGTIALLGEGWNCPSVNTLVLGNKSSSIVQVQQLRGRALRSANNKSLSHLWHLGVYVPEVSWKEQPELSPIMRRLSFIEGISNQQIPDTITSGQARFNFPNEPTKENLENYNQQNFFFAQQRSLLTKFWEESLSKGTHLSMPIIVRQEATSSEFQSKKEQYSELANTRLSFWGALFQGDFLLYLRQQRTRYLWKKECGLRSVFAKSLLSTYQEQQKLSKNISLYIDFNEDQFTVRIKNGTYQEERFFNEALMELLEPVQDTRYLVEINNRYFAVPKDLARNKEAANSFLREIKRKQRNCRLVYTRNLLGRQKLLQARIQALQQRNHKIVQEHLWY